MSARQLPLRTSSPHRQRGVVLLVMLVIMVIGALALFVNALSSSNPQISRDKVTADALAKAKEALIGRATADANLPGSLPCPDTNDDGSAELFVYVSASNTYECPSYIGRLPWRTLGIPELRDGAGEELWYALSSPFRDQTLTPHTINSDTTGTLNVTDVTSAATVASNLVAIVFAPGSALTGATNQSRSSSTTISCSTDGNSEAENLCATNYLEGTNATSTTNTSFSTGAASNSFNDQAIYITHDQLLAPVEMRIAREAKKCLDDYAASSSGRYPWAEPDNDSTYTGAGTWSTLFGRMTLQPNIFIISDSGSAPSTLKSALDALKAALDAYKASPTSTNQTNLNNAANYVISLKYSTSISSTTIDQAGDYGLYYASGSTTYTTASTYIQTAASALYDTAMSSTWPSSCTLFTSSYWPNWENEVFYQVASGNAPGHSTCNLSCLFISGSGNPDSGNGTYRAAVIVARQAIKVSGTLQDRTSSNFDPPSNYLEGANQNDGTGGTCTTPGGPPSWSPPAAGGKHSSTKTFYTCTMLSQKFETYQSTDPSYSSVNDLVLCLDGKINCI